MARLGSLTIALALLAGPSAARAGTVLEGSVGSGLRWQPTPVERIPTNVMLAGGYSFAGALKLELGVVGNLADVNHSQFDLDIRPMVVLKPPVLPFYVRGILGVSGLVEGPAAVNYGGALGVRIGALGVGAFLEAGALSRRVTIDGQHRDAWVAEGRLGFYWD
ncbi:MAG TPA: hypothetical protein VFG59_08305 [Anaeromyxobacter sp.]|nr:hypothetical protein [Anaeromyxobacter sp.]